ncbi:MAG: hypothetical protein WCQ54_13395 [Clostridiaceae bacterium]
MAKPLCSSLNSEVAAEKILVFIIYLKINITDYFTPALSMIKLG